MKRLNRFIVLNVHYPYLFKSPVEGYCCRLLASMFASVLNTENCSWWNCLWSYQLSALYSYGDINESVSEMWTPQKLNREYIWRSSELFNLWFSVFAIWYNSPLLHHSFDHIPQCNYMFYVTQIYIKCFSCGIRPNCSIHSFQVQMVVSVTLQLFLQTAHCNVHPS
jgi:hypothetical protein